MTPRERGPAARADVVHELPHLPGREPLVPVVVDHHHRRAIARAEAFDLDERERAGRIGLARLDPELGAQLLGHPFGAKERARQRTADVQHVLPHRLRVEHRVVRHDVLHLRGRAANLQRNVPHGRRRQISLLGLREVQRIENGGLPLVVRIPRHVLVELGLVLGRVREVSARLGQRAFRLVELRRRVLHLRMKAHRSQSPMTTSFEPITATTSAIRPPSTSFGSAWIAMNDGARILTRHGRFVPSETM